MVISCVFTNSFFKKKLFLIKANITDWQCCLYQKPWELHENVTFLWLLVVVAQHSSWCSWLYTNSSLYPVISYVHHNIHFLPTVESVISDQNSVSYGNQQGHPLAQFFRGTALQSGRSQIQYPMVSLEFFIYINLRAALWPYSQLNPRQNWVPGIFPVGIKAAGA
jgi:hypothetical protein